MLVIDDEELVRKTAQATLSQYGYRVLTAENGKTGADLFDQLTSAKGAIKVFCEVAET